MANREVLYQKVFHKNEFAEEIQYHDNSLFNAVHPHAICMRAYLVSSIIPGGFFKSGFGRDYWDFFFVQSGRGLLGLNGKDFIMKKGDLCILPPRALFSLTVEKNAVSPLKRQVLTLHSGPITELLCGQGALAEKTIIHLSAPERLPEFFRKIENFCEEQSPERLPELSMLCYGFLLEVVRQCESMRLKSDFERIMFCIARTPGNNYTLGSIARSCGVSVRTLNRLFRKNCDCTPMEFVIKRRLDVARALLQKDDFTAADIARICGYSNIPHFTREFKKYHGLTPHAWRVEFMGKKSALKFPFPPDNVNPDWTRIHRRGNS